MKSLEGQTIKKWEMMRSKLKGWKELACVNIKWEKLSIIRGWWWLVVSGQMVIISAGDEEESQSGVLMDERVASSWCRLRVATIILVKTGLKHSYF